MNFLLTRHPFNENYYSTILCIIVLLLPYFISISNLFIIFLSIIWIRDLFKREYYLILKSNFKYILPFFLLFIAYLLSTLYSSNVQEALRILERKIPILLLPLIISSIPFSRKDIEKIFYYFILSIALCCLIAFILSVWYFLHNPNEYYLEKALWYIPKTIGFHAPYLALYLVVSNIFCYYFFLHKTIVAKSIIIFLINNIFLLLISSRTALAINWVFIITFSSYYLYRNKGRTITLLNVAALITILYLAYVNIPYLHTKISKITEAAYGVNHRVISAKAALKVIRESPILGVGLGDIQLELNKKLTDASYAKYNVHNQYLHELMAYGLFGFAFFLSIFIVGYYKALANKDMTFTLFLSAFLILFLTEVILARYKGIMLFSLFYPLFINLNIQKNFKANKCELNQPLYTIG